MKYNKDDHLIVNNVEIKGTRKYKKGSFYCILNGKTYDDLMGLRNAIKPVMSSKDYYDLYYKKEDEGFCLECNSATSFISVFDGYNKYCANNCYFKTVDHKEIVSNRFIKNPQKLEQFRERSIKTRAKRTPEQLEDMRIRKNSTVKARYGDKYLSNRVKNQWKLKTKEDIANQIEKAKNTKKINGTAEYNSYVHANKEILINGVSIFCQGYEDAVIKFLVYDCGFLLSDLSFGKDVPRVKHSCLSGVYRPDIFINKLNLIIEVKSDYTFIKDINMGCIKHKSSFDNGFNHVYFVISKLELGRVLSNLDKNYFKKFLDMTISNQASKEEGSKTRILNPYTPIAIGSGSATALKRLSKECVI
jgi:hypothetical protein